MDEDFDYLVTPIAFNTTVTIQSDQWEIERVFGSPGCDERGELLKISSLFPSQKKNNSLTKGGVILLKLIPKAPISTGTGTGTGSPSILTATLRYEDACDGKVYCDESIIDFSPVLPLPVADGNTATPPLPSLLPGATQEYYSNVGVRKAIVITRFVNLLQQWAAYEYSVALRRDHDIACREALADVIAEKAGATLPPPLPPPAPVPSPESGLGASPPFIPNPDRVEWGNQMVPFAVSDAYRLLFESFAGYFAMEMSAIGDPDEVLFVRSTNNHCLALSRGEKPDTLFSSSSSP
jgi:Ca-activated chloride channel homolog